MVQNFCYFVKVKALKTEFKSYFALKEQVARYRILDDTQMEFGVIILILCIFINIEAFLGRSVIKKNSNWRIRNALLL